MPVTARYKTQKHNKKLLRSRRVQIHLVSDEDDPLENTHQPHHLDGARRTARCISHHQYGSTLHCVAYYHNTPANKIGDTRAHPGVELRCSAAELSGRPHAYSTDGLFDVPYPRGKHSMAYLLLPGAQSNTSSEPSTSSLCVYAPRGPTKTSLRQAASTSSRVTNAVEVHGRRGQ